MISVFRSSSCISVTHETTALKHKVLFFVIYVLVLSQQQGVKLFLAGRLHSAWLDLSGPDQNSTSSSDSLHPAVLLFFTTMDHTGARQSPAPGGRSSSPASGVPQPSPRSRSAVTSLHKSSIVRSDAALRSKRQAAGPGSLLLDTVDLQPAETERDRPPDPPVTTAGGVEDSSSSLTQTTVIQIQGRPVAKVNIKM